MTPSGPWWTHGVVDPAAIAIVAGWVGLQLRGAAVRARRGVRRPRATAAFLLGAAVVLLSQLGPPAAWSGVLLWPHMVQHLLLTVVAAPLLALGTPVTTVRVALPDTARHTFAHVARRTRRWRRRSGVPPLVLATGLHVAVLWCWHAPALYDTAARHPALHLLEHATMLGSAVWLWSEVWATARRGRGAQALATACLAALIVQGGLLGALLTFARRSLFAVYDGAAGLSALEDQQLAGALMWVPPGFLYATVAIRRFLGWLRAAETELRQRERRLRELDTGAPLAAPPTTGGASRTAMGHGEGAGQ